ncbi:MAG: hypothetical protein JNK87_18120, partial [Bryobacterales bacterium]|nr:hypothetical protein [Bryobacterales bacterium]
MALIAPVSSFVSTFRNQTPDDSAVVRAIASIRELAEHPELENVHPELLNQALNDLAEATEALLKNETYALAEADLKMLRQVVIKASQDPHPFPNAERDEGFQESPSWGKPAARIAASEALMILAWREATPIESTKEAIVTLSRDACAPVRYQIAANLNLIFKTNRELMWELLDESATRENNYGVLQGTLAVLQRCAWADVPRVAALAKHVFSRSLESGRGADRVREQCVDIFIGLSLWHEEATCTVVINRMLSAPKDYSKDIRNAIFDLGNNLTHEKEVVRDRAFKLLQRILTVSLAGMRQVEAEHPAPYGTWPENVRTEYGEYVHNVDSVAQRLYFSSGAFGNPDAESTPVPSSFYLSAAPLLKDLASVGHAHTAHYVLQTVAHFASEDPVGVLLLVGDIVRASSAYGYQYESMGEDVVISLMERYLSE